MLAQIVLTPAESKKLISKAIVKLDVVRRAASEGMLLMHPSSSTYFIVEEVTGMKPETDFWVCGVVTQRGMCVEKKMAARDGYSPDDLSTDPGDLRASWIIKHNEFTAGEKLSGLLKSMTSNDAYIKGVNALDYQGNVGVLYGYARSIGYIISAWRKRKFHLIYPAGLEKLIPTPIQQAVREAKLLEYRYAMGMPTGLFPMPEGITVTEIDAIKILSGATATSIASGGLGGAEGAIALIINGTDNQVEKAIEFIEQSKGAELPKVNLCDCNECSVPHCKFPVGDKPWVSS